MIRAFIQKNRLSFLLGGVGLLLGATAGFLYWKYVGCISGTCAIWTNPFRSTIYGGLLGTFILLIFVPDPKKDPNT